MIGSLLGSLGSIGGSIAGMAMQQAGINKAMGLIDDAGETAAGASLRAADVLARAARRSSYIARVAALKSGDTLIAGQKRARDRMLMGYRRARTAFHKGMDKSLGSIEAHYQVGQRANRLYADILGLNGSDAQARGYELYKHSPGFQDAVDYGIGQIKQKLAGVGNYRSGATIKAVQDYARKSQLDDFYRWRDLLNQRQSEGAMMGQFRSGLYNRIADYDSQSALGMAGVRAGAALGIANARAARRLGAARARIGGQLGVGSALSGGILGAGNARASALTSQAQLAAYSGGAAGGGGGGSITSGLGGEGGGFNDQLFSFFG